MQENKEERMRKYQTSARAGAPWTKAFSFSWVTWKRTRSALKQLNVVLTNNKERGIRFSPISTRRVERGRSNLAERPWHPIGSDYKSIQPIIAHGLREDSGNHAGLNMNSLFHILSELALLVHWVTLRIRLIPSISTFCYRYNSFSKWLKRWVTRQSTSSWRWWGRILTRSTSVWSRLLRWASSRSLIQKGWVFLLLRSGMLNWFLSRISQLWSKIVNPGFCLTEGE